MQCAPIQQFHNCTAHILYQGTTRLWTSSFMGNLERGSTRDFERWMKEGSGNEASLSVGVLWGEPRGRVPLLGSPKDTLSKALEMGICFHRGPFWGTWGDVPPLRPLREKGKIFFIRRTFVRNSRVLLMKVLETDNSLHMGPCWGTWRGFIYHDFLRDRWRALETEHLFLIQLGCLFGPRLC